MSVINMYTKCKDFSQHLIMNKRNHMKSLMLGHFYLCHNLPQWLSNGGTADPLGNGRDTWQCREMCLVVMRGQRQESHLAPKVQSTEVGTVGCSINSLTPLTGPMRQFILPMLQTRSMSHRQVRWLFQGHRVQAVGHRVRALHHHPALPSLQPGKLTPGPLLQQCHFHSWILRPLCQCALRDPGTITEA